jgi:hypothetical protein
MLGDNEMKILALAVIFAATVSTAAIAQEENRPPHYPTHEELQERFKAHDAECEKLHREHSYDLTQCGPDVPVYVYR